MSPDPERLQPKNAEKTEKTEKGHRPLRNFITGKGFFNHKSILPTDTASRVAELASTKEGREYLQSLIDKEQPQTGSTSTQDASRAYHTHSDNSSTTDMKPLSRHMSIAPHTKFSEVNPAREVQELEEKQRRIGSSQQEVEDLDAVRKRYEDKDGKILITKEKLLEVEELFRGELQVLLAEGVHPSNLMLTDRGAKETDQSQIDEKIKHYMNIDIGKLEDELKNHEKFRRKGVKSLNYMVKRAYDEEVLDLVTSLTVAHLTQSKHRRVFAYPDKKDNGTVLDKDPENTVKSDDSSTDSSSNTLVSDKVSRRSSNDPENRKDNSVKFDDPVQESSKQIPEGMIDLWKDVRREIEHKRDFKKETRKYRKLRHHIERRRLETSEHIAIIWRVRNIRSLFYSHRQLKQGVREEFDQSQASYDHFKEKAANQSPGKGERLIRRIRGLKPYEERDSRPRGRIGKEIGSWKETIELEKKYHTMRDEIHEHRILYDLPHEKIKQEINRLYGDEKSEEAKEARLAFKKYEAEYRKNGKQTHDLFMTLQYNHHKEMENVKESIIKRLNSRWNDVASIGTSPVTVVGTALTVVAFV